MNIMSSKETDNGDQDAAAAVRIVVGLVLVTVAGCLNGSWNAAFSPKLGLAVGKNSTTVEVLATGRRATVLPTRQQQQRKQSWMRRTSSSIRDSWSKARERRRSTAAATAADTTSNVVDLDYHYSWVLFQLFAALINIPICLYWAGGPARVAWIVAESSAIDLFLICFFSLLWGIGSVGFGLACKVAGVGLGTNLMMGIIMVLGTVLPLLLNKQGGTPAGGMIWAGLIVCCCGLVFSVKSLSTRDQDEAKARKDADEHSRRQNMRSMTNQTTNPDDQDATRETFEEISNVHKRGENAQTESMEDGQPKTASSQSSDEQGVVVHSKEETYSTLYKVFVCFVSGIFATQLQFAFVFGENLIARAKSLDGPNAPSPSSGAASVIWLFAISIGAPVSFAYGLYSSPKHIPLSTLWKAPWYRYVLILLTTSIPWDAHIHLYGYSTSTLPSAIAASVAWPILMMMTVTAGLVWSLALGEWKLASRQAKLQLYIGILIVFAGVALLMASVALS